ncbi:Penicillin-binding protein activator LpoA (PBP activator LpoA), partial [Durusdinium trenchii]
MQLAAVLHPQGDWGARVADAFVAEFSAGGGIVTALTDFDEDATGATRQLLNLGQSQARARQLRRYAPAAIEFEPRRRQDIDVVFMVANTEHARQLKPALNFHYASDLPVLATSHVYAGSPAPGRDSDLNGIRFVDIPWLLDNESELHRLSNNVWPEGHGRFERLFALGDWGARVADAFVAEFSAGGGIVTALTDFDEDATGATRQLLNLGQSQARARQLRRYAPAAIEFEPRRRQDIDVVFMVANTEHARQLKPALNFHYASDLPVLATSHVYAGSPAPGRDSDLNGIRFVDIPWLLDNESELHRLSNNVWPEGHGRFERLFALGVDAYRLH